MHDGKAAAVYPKIVQRPVDIGKAVFDANHVGATGGDARGNIGLEIICGALGNVVKIDREIRRNAAGDGHIILFHFAVIESEELRRHNPDAIRAD